MKTAPVRDPDSEQCFHAEVRRGCLPVCIYVIDSEGCWLSRTYCYVSASLEQSEHVVQLGEANRS